MEQQYLAARLERAGRRCIVQVVERSETLRGMSILVERLCLAAVCVSTTAPGQIPMPVVVT